MKPRLGFVGPGRVGWALARASSAAGYEVTGIAGGSEQARVALAAAVGARTLPDPAELDAEMVLLTVPDRELEPLARSIRAVTEAFLVHLAGALPASSLGVSRAGSFHPLRSFAGAARDVDLRGCGVAIDATDESLERDLRELAEGLGMVPLLVPPEGRSRYHAAAVLAGNAPIALLEAARRQLDALGVPSAAGAGVLAGLLASVAANLAELGFEDALSGPIRRGDVETVGRNLTALDATDPNAAELYRVVGRSLLAFVQGLADQPPAGALEAIADLLRPRAG